MKTSRSRQNQAFGPQTVYFRVIVCLVLMICAESFTPTQSVSSNDRERGRTMLREIKEEIQKKYYDEKFHGMDLDLRFKAADDKISEASSLGQIFAIIAQVLSELNDSHTFFIPPSRASRTEYGWNMQMIGDKCYVVAVKPGSDAESKGVKMGDEVISLNGYGPTRENFWKLQYLYHTLKPQPGLRVILRNPSGEERELELMAKVKEMERVVADYLVFYSIGEAVNEGIIRKDRFKELSKQVIVWKMPRFVISKQEVDDAMSKVGKYGTLILDLRNNHGGYVSALEQLLGYFFERNIKIADLKSRKKEEPMVAKTRGDNGYKGKLIVLVDSNSASASELFARMIQLEKRGTVLGDRTAGAVMQSRNIHLRKGVITMIFYGVSITVADLVMPDGKSLEHVGVAPDEPLIPTAKDLAANRDIVLARAASLAGIHIEPEKAGALFPVEWKKQ